MKQLTILLFVLVVFAACQREEKTAEVNPPKDYSSPTPVTTMQQTGTSTVTAPPVPEINRSIVMMGKALGTKGEVISEATEFASGESLFVAVKTEGAPPGSVVQVEVYGPSKAKVAQPAKSPTAGGEFTIFQLTDRQAWPAGPYTVEAWMNGKQLGTRTFTVTGGA